MPMYEYYCPDCGTKFEALRPMGKADAPIPCQSCAGGRASRVLSLFAAHSKTEGGGSSASAQSFAGHGGGGGCCGGMCGCKH